MSWTGPAFVAGLGVVFAGVGGSRLVRERLLRRRGATARGVVVAVPSGAPPAGPHGPPLRHPVVRFTTGEGRQVEVTSPAGSSESLLLPGHRVTVHYDPRDPTRASIPEQETGVYRLLCAIGLALLLGTGVYLVEPRVVSVLPTIAPVLIGAVFAGVGVFGIRRSWKITHGGRSDGIVVGSVASESRNGFPQHHPVVRYVLRDGSVIESASVVGHTGRPLPYGTRVRVRYDRAEPERVMLSHDGTPASYWIFGVIGIVLLAVGLVIVAAILT